MQPAHADILVLAGEVRFPSYCLRTGYELDRTKEYSMGSARRFMHEHTPIRAAHDGFFMPAHTLGIRRRDHYAGGLTSSNTPKKRRRVARRNRILQMFDDGRLIGVGMSKAKRKKGRNADLPPRETTEAMRTRLRAFAELTRERTARLVDARIPEDVTVLAGPLRKIRRCQ